MSPLLWSDVVSSCRIIAEMGLVPVHVYSDVPWVPYADLFKKIGFISNATVVGLDNLISELKSLSVQQLEEKERHIESLLGSHFSTSGVLQQIELYLKGGATDLRCQALPPTTRDAAYVSKVKKEQQNIPPVKSAVDKPSSNVQPQLLTCSNTKRMPSIPSSRVSGNVLRKGSNLFTGNWGNVLSPYWAARTMAHLGGYAYEGSRFGGKTWMNYLPTKAPPPQRSQNEMFQQTCMKCKKYVYFHNGDCASGWGQMASVISSDTRSALLQYSKQAPKGENDAVHNFFRPDDWLIYNRW